MVKFLGHLAQGKRNEAIAEELTISVPTVQTHVQRILSKLEVHSRVNRVGFPGSWR